MSLNKKLSMSMIYYGLRLATEQYDVGKKFADNLYTFFNEGDNWKCVPEVLEGWGCIEDGGRVNLYLLPNPALLRPCAKLSTIYNMGHKPMPHPMFAEDDADPDLFRRMVYSHRMAYDLLYLHKLPHHNVENPDEVEGVKLFLEKSSFMGLDDHLTPIIGP